MLTFPLAILTSARRAAFQLDLAGAEELTTRGTAAFGGRHTSLLVSVKVKPVGARATFNASAVVAGIVVKSGASTGTRRAALPEARFPGTCWLADSVFVVVPFNRDSCFGTASSVVAKCTTDAIL